MERATAWYHQACSDLRQENADHHLGCVCPPWVCSDLSQRACERDCYAGKASWIPGQNPSLKLAPTHAESHDEKSQA